MKIALPEKAQTGRRKRILIVGAGVAGPTLAYWLNRFGHQVTIIERASALRLTGQTVDIRDEGREVVRRMGLGDRIDAHMTQEEGLRFVDDSNHVRAEHPRAPGKKAFVTDVEILRADLIRILSEITQAGVEYVYGDHVTGLEDTGETVKVHFHGSPMRAFDLVIGADGMRSRTRSLVFGEVPLRHIGLYTAYFAIPYERQDGDWVRWHNCPGGKSILLRPDRGRTSRAYLYIRSRRRGVDLAGRDAIVSFVRDTFRHDAWEIPRIIRALEQADDFFFEDLGQVRMPKWSRGRVTLVGDAAYCATPISGMGTTLAIVGAYQLARAIAEHADHRDAFEHYEQRMRPYVRKAQAYRPWTIRLEQPASRAGIAAFYALKAFEQTPLGRLLSGLFTPKPEVPEFLGQAEQSHFGGVPHV